MSCKLWLTAAICVLIAFIVGRMPASESPRVGYIVVERYGEIDTVGFSIDQLKYDGEQDRYYILSDSGEKYYTSGKTIH